MKSYKIPKRSWPNFNSDYHSGFHNTLDVNRQKLIHAYDCRDKYEVVVPTSRFTLGRKLSKRKVLFRGTYYQCWEYVFNNGFFLGCF